MTTRAQFVVQFPEFAATNAPQVEAHLAAAELEIDREVWADKGDQGQMYLAAHKLALSPYGNNAEVVLKNSEPSHHGQTTYGVHYDAMAMAVGGAWRMTS